MDTTTYELVSGGTEGEIAVGTDEMGKKFCDVLKQTFLVEVTPITTVRVEAASPQAAVEKACEIAWEFDADSVEGQIIDG